jgi:putative ABC transport system ATP-binding protein
MSDNVVETIQLAKVYRRGKVPVPALNGIDITVEKGEMVGIVGPSGSGKTTLLNLIGGLDYPTGGRVLVDGTDLSGLGEQDLADYRLKKVGFIFQFYNLIPTLSALENVLLPMSLARVPDKEREDRAWILLKTVGIEARAHHMPDELSGGEQQRVAVARALANEPAVILADEPTGDLDSKSARRLMEILKSIQKDRKTTFVLVTHDPIVLAGCDRIYALRDGKVVQELTSKELEDVLLSDRYGRALDGIY